jgi:hypothetical protein
MPALEGQIPPRDRWAIVAYIRALQLSQHMPLKDLSSDEQAKATAAIAKSDQSPKETEGTDGGAGK